MKKPDWFELKVTLGNLLTIVPMLLGAVALYYDIRSDQALLRTEQSLIKQTQGRDAIRLDKLEARDEVFANNFAAYQRDTIQALTRLETQMGILLQAGARPSSPALGPRQ
ncbi:hypothetical protein [Phreatobacter oligotrophus]|uniref:Uncharacterized protein n=1 Tax=Phreatobacter oligotrophus TaxID=1122261 RepID=A0A2T4ZIX2_9HYPH|nr:hypothetical protein [Phreatobacter oligotrophus]PTM61929.1 hypothetical protein C8P69_101602 [Phreatobacter oligotrophus]